MRFRIYYSGGSIDGEDRRDWIASPDDDLQVVAVFVPPPKPGAPLPDRHTTGYVHCGVPDRMLYTGVDEYDPMGTGHIKRGRLIDDELYRAVWELARGDR